MHLKDTDEKFNRITGNLSCADANNKNWYNSIPFYADFNQWLNQVLGYTLRFHLYQNDNYTNELLLSPNRYERQTQIEKFTDEHMHTNASFCYEVISDK